VSRKCFGRGYGLVWRKCFGRGYVLVWRKCFGKGYGLVTKQTTRRINEFNPYPANLENKVNS
jgi:hypothetical protein